MPAAANIKHCPVLAYSRIFQLYRCLVKYFQLQHRQRPPRNCVDSRVLHQMTIVDTGIQRNNLLKFLESRFCFSRIDDLSRTDYFSRKRYQQICGLRRKSKFCNRKSSKCFVISKGLDGIHKLI
jgi:hypothetical protein